MIPHIHLWKKFSSTHRICRLCGEPETYRQSQLFRGEWFWGSANFDEWVNAFPIQLKLDQEKEKSYKEFKEKQKRLFVEDRKKGRAFLKSFHSSKETEEPTK